MAIASSSAAPASRGMIKPISVSDVHRLTSGQVVLDLQTAVKELVENALDAGATNVSIHFRDYGAESFEIVDNGSGIDSSNYSSIALKHYTSKLSSFSDLALVQTFGFRGEALSSLCALSDVSVHTATQEEAPMGTLIELDHSGKIKNCSKRAARQRGTTVTISGLFKSLPVRRKEFEKNLKREYTKAQNLLQAYALISKGVRWSTSNTPKGGRRTAQFNVNSSSTDNYLLGNVGALFGAKIGPTLMPLNLKLPLSFSRKVHATKSMTSDEDAEDQAGTTTVDIVGLISKPSYGSGRASSDRQFFYVNGRPWEPGRISRAFNEVYKTFNTNQYPFVIADFRLPTDSYDVNVSPDKRTIFLHEESRLIEKVKEGLEQLFEPSRRMYLVNGASHSFKTTGGIKQQTRLGQFATNASGEDGSPDQDSHERQEPEEGDTDEDVSVHSEDHAPNLDRTPHGERAGKADRCDHESRVRDTDDESQRTITRLGLERSQIDLEYKEDSEIPFDEEGPRSLPTDDDDSEPEELYPIIDESVSKETRSEWSVSRAESSSKRDYAGLLDTTQASWSPTKRQKIRDAIPPIQASPRKDGTNAVDPKAFLASLESYALPGSQVQSFEGAEEGSTPMDIQVEDETREADLETSSDHGNERQQNLDRLTQQGMEQSVVDEEDRMPSSSLLETLARQAAATATEGTDENDDCVILDFNLSSLRSRLQLRKRLTHKFQVESNKSPHTSQAEQELSAGAGISNQDEEQVERALSRVIHKDDFANMDIIGQFNLGFIIARRTRRSQHTHGDEHTRIATTEQVQDSESEEMDDLFIIDQHASDEKYNFETLQSTTTIRSQRLIAPRPLELSSSDELVAIEHQATLEANGFEISISTYGLPGSRIRLVSQPISKGIVFGVKDFEELLYLLRDVSPGSETAKAVRCSKARNMFASRACRKSVMIGTALNKRQMKAILKNMGTIEQPWNCPHGRPTMRHLTCLKMIEQGGALQKPGIDDINDWQSLKQWMH